MQAGLPADVFFSFAIQESRKDKEEIREAIDVMQDSGIYGPVHGKPHDLSLGASHDSSCMMQVGGSRASARQHKAVEWREFRVEAVDLIFKPCDLLFRDA